MLRDLFFSLFGLVELEEYTASPWGLNLYGVYLVMSIVLLLNLLIATLNKSYMDIEAEADAEWKATFTKIVLQHRSSSVSFVPAPFSLFSAASALISRRWRSNETKGPRNKTDKVNARQARIYQ